MKWLSCGYSLWFWVYCLGVNLKGPSCQGQVMSVKWGNPQLLQGHYNWDNGFKYLVLVRHTETDQNGSWSEWETAVFSVTASHMCSACSAHQTRPSRPRFQDVNLCLFQSALFSGYSPLSLTPWDCILRRKRIFYWFYLVIVKPLDLDQNTELYYASVSQGDGVNDMNGFF